MDIWRLARRSRRIALAMLVVSGVFAIQALAYSLFPVPTASAGTGTFYGADTTKMNNAVAGIWPQLNGPYCGIASAMAIANYGDQDAGQALRFTSQSQQNSVVSDNQSSAAASQWGYSIRSQNTVAGEVNISADFGIDPRGLAYMSFNYTPINFYYHDYIYRWQFAHSTQPSYSQQVQEGITTVASQLETWGEPIVVTINAGTHFVVVSGIWSTNDPNIFYPAQINSIVYRDPQDGTRHEVTLSQWTSGIAGYYPLWSKYYGDQSEDTGTPPLQIDPEPAVGPYKPSGSQVHWFNGFTWVTRDPNSGTGLWQPDWAFDAYTFGKLTTP